MTQTVIDASTVGALINLGLHKLWELHDPILTLEDVQPILEGMAIIIATEVERYDKGEVFTSALEVPVQASLITVMKHMLCEIHMDDFVLAEGTVRFNTGGN